MLKKWSETELEGVWPLFSETAYSTLPCALKGVVPARQQPTWKGFMHRANVSWIWPEVAGGAIDCTGAVQRAARQCETGDDPDSQLCTQQCFNAAALMAIAARL